MFLFSFFSNLHCVTTSEGLFLSTWEWISTISLEAGWQDRLDDGLISPLFAKARFIVAQSLCAVVRHGCQMIAMFDNFTPDGLFSLAGPAQRVVGSQQR